MFSGFGSKTVNSLLQYRAHMTIEEVLTHLDLLSNLSTNESGKSELAAILTTLLKLFKYMLLEYNDSEMNIVITNIINNIVTRNMMKPRDVTKITVVMAEISTEVTTKLIHCRMDVFIFIAIKNFLLISADKDEKPNKSNSGKEARQKRTE